MTLWLTLKRVFLMTYEKGLFAQADPGIVSGSTIERKKMSTKTIYKRIALVAVAALGAGVLSVAPASAAAGQITVTGAVVKGAAGATTTATGITGNQVIFTFEEQAADAALLYVNTTGGTIVSASAAATGSIAATGSSLANGATWTTGTGATTGTFAVTSATAGTQVVTIQALDTVTGVYTTVAALTITWVAAATTDLASATAYVLANGDTCNAATAASTVGSMDYTLASGSALVLCIVLKNGAAGAYTRSTAVSVIGNGIGQVNGAAVAADGTVTAGFKEFPIFGNGLPGTATFSVSASSTAADGVTAVTKTSTASVIVNGDFTAITLANLKSAIAYTGATAGTIDYAATDAKGNAAAVNLGSGATWYVESDKSTTAVSSAASNNSSATVASAAAETITAATGASADTGKVTVTTAAAAYEKLTIWVTKKNAAGTTITSNKVTVFVSTTSAKSVTVTAVKATTGGYTVTVTALSDPATTGTAYPVIDGEAITIGASAGVLSATTGTTGKAGNATFTYYEPQFSGTILMTATADTAVGTASLVITGGALDAVTALINSLVAKINALNKLVAKIQKKVKA